MGLEATPSYTDVEIEFGEKVCTWLLEKLDSQDRLSFKTKALEGLNPSSA
jgi:hypothetical protein